MSQNCKIGIQKAVKFKYIINCTLLYGSKFNFFVPRTAANLYTDVNKKWAADTLWNWRIQHIMLRTDLKRQKNSLEAVDHADS